jgi:hypothetical protein
MITLESLRSALLSTDPYEAVDRLVRSELGSGRRTREIFNEINSMLHEVRLTDGLTEDGEEALFGTLDALLGHCHEDCRYKDPLGIASPPQSKIDSLADETTPAPS